MHVAMFLLMTAGVPFDLFTMPVLLTLVSFLA